MDIDLSGASGAVSFPISYSINSPSNNFHIEAADNNYGVIELLSDSTYRFSRFPYNSNNNIFTEDVTVTAKINFRSLYVLFVQNIVASFFIGARKIAAPHEYCIVKFRQYENYSTLKNTNDVPFQIESIIENRLVSINGLLTVGLSSKRMAINQINLSVTQTGDSYLQENSVINGFDFYVAIAASKQAHKLSKFDTNTLVNIEVISLDLIDVQAVNLIDIGDTEYFIVHDPEASSFLVGRDSPSLKLIHLEPLQGGNPVSQILTFPFSRVMMTVNQDNNSLDFYKTETMKCHSSCQSDTCQITNFVNERCDKCSLEYGTFQALNDFGSPACNACHTSCNECGTGGQPCLKCRDPNTFPIGLSCRLCHQSCLTCSSALIDGCFSCKAGYRFLKGKCLQCNDPNCSTCDENNTSICLECLSGFSLSNTKCYLCEANCETCTGAGVDKCVKCSSGYFLESGNCLQCDPSCSECLGPLNTHCTACDTPQFELRKGQCFDTASITCSEGCWICTGSTFAECETCLLGYSYIDGRCLNLTDTNCEIQTQDGVCTRCVPGYVKSHPNNSGCVLCGNNCRHCFSIGLYFCSSCEPPFVLFSGLCWDSSTCDNTCATCQGPRPQDCLTCHGATTLNNGRCYDSCHPSCLTCFGPEDNNCLTCSGGMEASGLQCITCSTGCLTCFGSGITSCLSCQSGYTLIIDTCVPDTNVCHANCDICKGPNTNSCLTCKPGFTLVGAKCILCDPSCNKSCSGTLPTDCVTLLSLHPFCLNTFLFNSGYPSHCLNCKPGYQIIGNTCYDPAVPSTKCPDNCIDCVGNKSGLCLQCDPMITDLYFWSGRCNVKRDGCDKVMWDRCATCLPGFIPITHIYIDGLECVPPGFDQYNCGTNCYFCDPVYSLAGSGNLNCLQCNPNSTLWRGRCYLKPPNCLDANHKGQCILCEDGFISVGNGCESGCHPSCKHRRCTGGGAGECTECPVDGFQVRNTCWTSQNCHASCKSCYGPDVDNCLSCEDDRTLLQRQCIQCQPGCSTCTDINDSNTCTSCKEGYSFKKVGAALTCIQCHESCGECWKANDPKGCITCKDTAHHLYGSECLQCDSSCIKGCFQANDPDSCYRCESPLVFLDQSIPTVDKLNCIQCEQDCNQCFGVGPGQCLVCKPGFTLHGDRTCKQCHSSCRLCSGPAQNQCTKCLKEQYLTSGGECLDCHPSCNSCSGTGEEDCVTCKRGYSRVANKCILCHITCYECQGPNPTDCTSCFLPQSLNSFGQCLTCHPSCGTCSGGLLIECLTCDLGNTFISSNSTCYNGCYTGYYLDSITGACTLCSSNCKTCNGGLNTDCILCADGYIMERGICRIECQTYQYFDDSSQTCIDCHSSCLTCRDSSDPSNCETCSPQYELFSSSCLLLCKNDEYRESSLGQCQKCHSLCTRCFGPIESHCTQCKIGVTLKNENLCKLECTPSQYIDNIKCKDCYSNCLTCSGPNNTDCLSCGQGSNLVNGQCICAIDNGKYIDLGTRECLDCHSRCLSCTNPTLRDCTSCRPEFYEINYSSEMNSNQFIPCLIKCPEEYRPDTSNMKCLKCFSGCSECTGPSQSECTKCTRGYFLFQNSCLSQCPQEKYKDSKTNTCQACSQNCLSCSSSNSCISCSANFYLFKEECLETCPKNYYPKVKNQHSTCEQCQEDCKKCIDSKTCQKCQEGLFIFSGRCTNTCPEGSKTFIDENQRINCVQISCLSNCERCDTITKDCLQCKATTSSGLLQILFEGQCIPCNTKNGLKVVDGYCHEVCGDGILYKLSKNFEDSFYQDCDDENTESGDGCSSDCRIERAKICTRQYRTIDKKNLKIPDECIKEQEIKLKRNSNIFDGVSYLLRFERNIPNFEDFDSSYYLEYIKEKDIDTLKTIDFISERGSPRILKIIFIESQLDPKYNGYISIRRFENATKYYEDTEGYRAIIDGTNSTFNFDYEQYLKDKETAGNYERLSSISKNGMIKTVIIFLMLNPIVFDFVVNILQKLVYFRLLDVMPPTNLDYFYRIFSDTTNINFGSLEGEIVGESPKNKTNNIDSSEGESQSEERAGNLTRVDTYLGLSIKDQTPSQKFKDLNFNSFSIKMTFVPFIMILAIYTLGIIVQTLRIRNSKKYYDKEKKEIVFILTRQSLFSDIYTTVCDFLVWNVLIRMILLSTQMITLSAFLNLSQAPWFTSIGSTISFIFSIVLIGLIIGVVTTVTFSIRKFQKYGGVVQEQMKLLQDVKHESCMHIHYKTYKYLIKTTIFSLSACFLNRIPILGCLILIIGELFQLGWLIWKRPYLSTFMNIKDIVEGISMIMIGILYQIMIIFQNSELIQKES